MKMTNTTTTADTETEEQQETFCIEPSIGLIHDRPISTTKRPLSSSTTTRAPHPNHSLTLERVSRNGSPPPLKTEASRQSGPESRVPGRETPTPPASRRWVPPSLRPQHGLTQEAQNDAVFRKVRGILNKLTPENFQKLSDDLLKIDLNSKIILNGVIHLLFEKALDEQKYSSMYAQLCKRLSVEAPNFDETGNSRTFLTLLLNVCRDRFLNRASVNHFNHHDADDEEKMLIAKQKMLGNVKFIGELSKLDMLREDRLHKCVQELLDKNRSSTTKDRCEDLECLSQLIRTCGKNMDTVKGKVLMDQYFEVMEKYSLSSKYPARIRFMLRDVIELRKRDWVPRKMINEGPMPMDQLQPDEDNMRSPFVNRNHRNHQPNDSEPHHWMNKISSMNLQSNHSSDWNGLSVTNSSHYSQPYNSSPGNYNNRDYRDSSRGGGNMSYRNNSRDNQHYNNNQNNQTQNRYNNNNNNNKNMSHNNNQTNMSHNSSNNSMNMMNNKDLAPRFKRNLINSTPDPSDDLTFRPAANSLLFKRNINIKSPVLPLVQSRPNSNSSTAGNQHHLSSNNTAVDPPLPPVVSTIGVAAKLINPQPVNNLLKKDQVLIKQASLEKPKQTKKDKGPIKEEVLKKVQAFIVENFITNNDENKKNISDIISLFIELKVPDKFMRDALTTVLEEIVDKPEDIHEHVFEMLVAMRTQNKLHTVAIIDCFKAILNGKNENIIPRIATLVATLLCRSVTSKLCRINDVATLTDNGQHYPLFLLVLQQLNKKLGKVELTALFNESKVNLMTTLPEVDRSKERMAEILEDRSLSFLYPLLKLQGELQKQIQSDPKPSTLYKYIKDNVDATCYNDPGFITALLNVLIKFITQETTLAEGVDRTQNPSKALAEQEKLHLEKYCPVLNAFLAGNSDLQLVAIYVLQTFCHAAHFPKGMLLRWFTALYDLNVIEEESFLRWKEDLSDVYPGKGDALFQVNTYLTWLEQAESEEEEEDDD